ncbi:MAG: indole-3-glycerol phosphate synthase TrpC [Actinomycetota bacterium]
MTVLDEIIVGVREDLAARRGSLSKLMELISAAPPTLDAVAALKASGMSIIAEVKRSSPSKGSLAAISDPAKLARKYQDGGASAVSVLTEGRRFGGSLSDLVSVRQEISLPILRKDFMVDEFQFFEARACGADIVLLIVAALSSNQLKDFAALAQELGMKSLIEVHTEDELERALAISPEIVGVNSRNLRDLSVNPVVFQELIPQIPSSIVKVAESGISTREDVIAAELAGADAVLVGEALVRGDDPTTTIRQLIGSK